MSQELHTVSPGAQARVGSPNIPVRQGERHYILFISTEYWGSTEKRWWNNPLQSLTVMVYLNTNMYLASFVDNPCSLEILNAVDSKLCYSCFTKNSHRGASNWDLVRWRGGGKWGRSNTWFLTPVPMVQFSCLCTCTELTVTAANTGSLTYWFWKQSSSPVNSFVDEWAFVCGEREIGIVSQAEQNIRYCWGAK